MIHRNHLLKVLSATLLFAIAGHAEPEITSAVISGGGGSSSGSGDVSLTGTLGQPVAGISAAGSTTLHAGFWGTDLEVVIIHDNAFEEWMANLPLADKPPEGQRGPDDSPAGDGVGNLLKFAFGLLPLQPAADAQPRFVAVGDNQALAIEFVRSKDAEVGLSVVGSEDLEIWTPVPHIEQTWENPALPQQRENIRLLTSLKVGDEPRYFLRLKVTVE